MDDEFVIKNNKQVQQGIKAIPEIFTSRYVINSQKSSYEYRPMVKAVYAVEFEIFGANPHISHFFNVLLYALSISLLYFLLQKMFPHYGAVFPFLVCVIFLLHPLHSEVVLSIKNRDIILSFLGALLALYFYMRSLEEKKPWLVLFGAFFMMFALMSKKDAMTYFAIIPFTLWYLKDFPLKRMGWIFLSFLLVVVTFRMLIRNTAQEVERKFLEWENPLYQDTTILERIPTGIYSIWFYLKMFLLPKPLISYYGYNQVPISSWSDPIVWFVLVAIVAVLFFVLKHFKTNKTPVYGIIYFLLAISMFTNILIPVVGIVAERFAFVPSLGLSILAAYGLLKLMKVEFGNRSLQFPSLKSSLGLLIAVMIIIMGSAVFIRTDDWKSSFSLYEADAKKAKESAHANSLYAAACIQKIKENPKMGTEEKRKYVTTSVKHYKESLRIIPDYTSSLNNLGMVFYTYYGKPDQSIPYLKKAIQLDTNYVEAYFNLATCYSALKEFDLAEKNFLRTVAIDPDFTSTYFSLSNMYASLKEFDKIVQLNEEAIKKGVKSDIMYVNIGNVYFMDGDTLKALPYLEKAISINPNNKVLNSFLANYYKEKGDLIQANFYYDLMSRSVKK